LGATWGGLQGLADPRHSASSAAAAGREEAGEAEEGEGGGGGDVAAGEGHGVDDFSAADLADSGADAGGEVDGPEHGGALINTHDGGEAEVSGREDVEATEDVDIGGGADAERADGLEGAGVGGGEADEGVARGVNAVERGGGGAEGAVGVGDVGDVGVGAEAGITGDVVQVGIGGDDAASGGVGDAVVLVGVADDAQGDGAGGVEVEPEVGAVEGDREGADEAGGAGEGVDAVEVVHSELRPGDKVNAYLLRLVLQNRADFVVRLPTLEISLINAQDEIVLQRTIPSSDYLTADQAGRMSNEGLVGNSMLPLEIKLQAPQSIMRYHLLVRYP